MNPRRITDRKEPAWWVVWWLILLFCLAVWAFLAYEVLL